MSKNNPWNFNHSITELENLHLDLSEKHAKSRLWDAYRWLEWEYNNIPTAKMIHGNEEVAKRNRHYEAIIGRKDVEIRKLKRLVSESVTKVEKAEGHGFLVTGIVGIAAIIGGILIGMFAV